MTSFNIYPVSEEQYQAQCRIDKLIYVWNELTHEEKLNLVISHFGFKDFVSCFNSIFKLQLIESKSYMEIETDFNSISDVEQINYLLKALTDVDNVDDWFDSYNGELSTTTFEILINKYEWYDVGHVISKKELDETVRSVWYGNDDLAIYARNQIEKHDSNLINKDFDSLNVEEKLLIYSYTEPLY